MELALREGYTTGGGEGATGRALARGETQLVEEPAADAFEPPRDGAHAEALAALGAGAVLAVPLAVRGRVLGALTLVRTAPGARFPPVDLALAEEIAARVALALENARLSEELGAHLRDREDALAEVAHDLRTPLQGIVLGALAIEHGSDPGAARRAADAIRRSDERMSRLVAGMLDLARIQAGRLALEPTVHDAAALVAEAVEAHAAIALEKDLRLEPRAEQGLAVRCDRERVGQVFANLIVGEEHDLVQAGEVHLDVRADPARHHARTLRVAVAVAPEHLAARATECELPGGRAATAPGARSVRVEVAAKPRQRGDRDAARRVQGRGGRYPLTRPIGRTPS